LEHSFTTPYNYPFETPMEGTSAAAVFDTIAQMFYVYTETLQLNDFALFLSGFVEELDIDTSKTAQDFLNEYPINSAGAADNQLAKIQILVCIKISLFYCYVSNYCYIDGDTNDAWQLATEASMWRGICYGVANQLAVIGKERTVFARAGAMKRAEKYKPLRDFVLERVGQKNYPSRRNAALSLRKEVLDLAKTLNIGLSVDQAEKTITGWLSGVTFASRQKP
jgi:hypothetical protein